MLYMIHIDQKIVKIENLKFSIALISRVKNNVPPCFHFSKHFPDPDNFFLWIKRQLKMNITHWYTINFQLASLMTVHGNSVEEVGFKMSPLKSRSLAKRFQQLQIFFRKKVQEQILVTLCFGYFELILPRCKY